MVVGTPNGRTFRKFQTRMDVPATLDSWAPWAGFKLRESSEASRTYQRGSGFWVAAQHLVVTWSGDDCTVEAWVKPPLIGKDLPIESGGFNGIAPRTVARDYVNELLRLLGQRPIK
jgi:hypothetical protein